MRYLLQEEGKRYYFQETITIGGDIYFKASLSLIPHLNRYISLKEHTATLDQEKETRFQNLLQDGCFYLSTKQHLASLLQRTSYLVSYQHCYETKELGISQQSESITKKAKESFLESKERESCALTRSSQCYGNDSRKRHQHASCIILLP
ncbi:hypothetical protein Rs2_12853 [Raphanus sativus]|nr:hypothetical protein Rs2_12853 [Raphanus sativus]